MCALVCFGSGLELGGRRGGVEEIHTGLLHCSDPCGYQHRVDAPPT